MHTHKLEVNDKTYHVTTTMMPSMMCIPSDQEIRLVVEKSDGSYVCEDTLIGPIQIAIINYTKKQLDSYADKLCRMLDVDTGKYD